MQPGRSKDLVAAAALAGALGLACFLLLRAHGLLGSSWMDGPRAFSSPLGAEVRHAVWSPPERLEGLGEASHPTLSSDGRWLVFASGTRGLNSELFLAEMEGGVPRDPRPLDALNSPADELAPAFGHGALYFASDRPGGAGGLDVWRAPYSAGEFGAVERLASGLNSAADETDPAPLAGTRTLVFASDRARADLDLYRATPDPDGFFVCEPLAELNTPANEREPASSDDPRSLTFASDRAGGAGAFDLYRALRFPDGATDGWGAPERIAELCTPRSERAPWLARDGFELWFAEEGADGAGTLLWTRARELLRVPAPAVTLAQWLTLAALLLLALLALLAKRWHALDILYKCLLVSLLLHLLLMLYFQTVVPAEKIYSTGTAEEGPSFRVRVAPPEPSGAASGLTGPVAPEREPFAAEAAPASAPPLLALTAPEPAEEAAPRGKSALEPAASEAPSPSLAQPAEASERYANRTPALALATPASAPRGAPTTDGPARAHAEAAAFGAASADAVALPTAEAALGELEHGVAPARAVAPGPSEAAEPALAQPAEATERNASRSPELALAPPASTPRSNQATGSPVRVQPETAVLGSALGTAAAGAAALPAAEAAAGELARGVARSPSLEPAASEPRAPVLAAPTERFERAAGTARALELQAPAANARAESPVAPTLQARLATERDAAALAGAAPLPPATSLPVPRASTPEAQGAPAPEPLHAMLAGTNAASAPDPILRAPAGNTAPAPAVPSVSFDATAGLASASASLPAAHAAGAPARPASAAPPQLGAPLSPAVQPLAAVPGDDRAAPPAPASLPAPSVASSAGHEPELRAPRAETNDAPARSSASFDAVAGLDVAIERSRAAPDGPERARAAAAPAALALPAPREFEPEALERPAPEPLPDRAPPPRLAETPYQNRFGEQKLRALEDFGGTPETEHAVAAGLDYLARIQGENGAWGQRSDAHSKYLDVRVGKSALALLAFLGAGHVPGGSSAHAAVADRAVRYLLSVQDERTGHFGRSCSYGHGIATYALAECFALTQETRLRAPLERAVAEILRNQSEHDDARFFGGWGYYFADGHVWNGDEWPRTSVTAWQVMALESATLGGLEVPGPAFAGAREFLVNTWDADLRAFRYDHDPERLSSGYPILPASTPAALFALALLDVDPRAAELAPARRFVLTRAPDGYRYTGDDDFVQHARGNLYFWYYATLALFRVGGAEWERWNAALQATLLPAQDADGSWRPLDTYSEYAGDDDQERTYSTAMCVLSLEIYYRYFTPLLKVR